MATRRQKKERAKDFIRDLVPSVPPVGPFRIPGRVLKAAENLAIALVESDPLNIISSDDAIRRLVNDDSIVLTPNDVKLINDPTLQMTNDNRIVRNRTRTARDVIRSSGQFSRANLLSRLPVDVSPTKKGRRKTSTNKKMSKALRLANEKFRKKNGQLRKGATQAQIMRYAHKLLKKM